MAAPKPVITSCKLNTAGTGIAVTWNLNGDCGFVFGMGDDWTVVFVYNGQGTLMLTKNNPNNSQTTVTIVEVPSGTTPSGSWYAVVRRYCNTWTSPNVYTDSAPMNVDMTEYTAAQAKATSPSYTADNMPYCPPVSGVSRELTKNSAGNYICVTSTNISAGGGGGGINLSWLWWIGGIVVIGGIAYLLLAPPKKGGPPRIVPITRRVIVPAGKYAVKGVKKVAKGVRMLPGAFGEEEEVKVVEGTI